ncbi:uncharacterized protein [Oscarella lobularis]|uniref:uncharacterized protein n=1 Tax=Oscarella lobularis TaxID=121494 RepID=UPI00331337BF
MGSGASQNRSPSVRNDPTYELFRQAFEDLPLSSRPSSVDRITELLSQTETTTLPTKTWILREEEEPLGIYLIVSGSVEICIERDGLVESLRHLERGMFFGELSTLFGATCSASARTRVDNTTLIRLPAQIFESYLPTDPRSKLRWCTRQRYLDTSKAFRHNELVNCVLKDAVRKVPLFRDWPSENVKKLTGLCKPLLVDADTLLREKSALELEMIILLSGRVSIDLPGQTSISLFPGTDVRWIGEEGLFMDERCRCSVKTDAPSVIVVIDRPLLQAVVSNNLQLEGSLKETNANWMKRREMIPYSLVHEYNGRLDIEVVIENLRQYPEFKNCSWPYLHNIAMNMRAMRDTAQSVLLCENLLDSLAVLVIEGELDIIDDEGLSLVHLTPNMCYYKQLRVPRAVCLRVASSSAVVLTFPKTLESSSTSTAAAVMHSK